MDARCCGSLGLLQYDPLDLVECDLVVAVIVELGRPGAFMRG